MSRKPVMLPVPVIEWSPTHVTAFDPTTKQRHEAGTLADLAPTLSQHKELIVAISRRSSFVRSARVPNASKEDVANIVRLQLANLFPVPASDLAMDFHLAEDVSSEGRLAVIVAVRSDLLKQLHNELKATGFRARTITSAAFGSWALAHTLEEQTCAVVEHSHEGLTIDVLAGGDLRYTRVAPFPAKAGELDAEVCRTFNIAKVPCSNVIGAGGLAFEGATSVYPGTTLEALTYPVLERVGISLEPPEAVAAREKQRLAQRMRFAILLCIITIGAAFFVFDARVREANRVATINAQYAAQLKQVTDVQRAADSRLKEVESLKAVVDRGFSPAQSLRDVVTVVTNSVPANVWLTGVNAERGKPLLLRGTARNNEAVSSYLGILSGEPRLRDVRLVFATDGKIEDTAVVQFSISAHVIGNFPLTELKARGGSAAR